MKLAVTLLLISVIFSAQAKTTITGTITDNARIPIAGVNVYIEGTYDGSSTDDLGNFSFTTTETGTKTLLASFLSFQTFTLHTDVSKMQHLKIILKDDVNSLNSVILNAGSFSAGDNSKASVLSPLDIVTTAGAAGDYVAALKTLPGTSNVSEDGRLFVRGGTADETSIFIDGQKMFQPFLATANNLPTRGRLSPFLFKGTNFSTGGYSAEYGNALSSVLQLNTIDEPTEEKSELQFINVGVGGGNTQKWKNNSISANAFYINLKPNQTFVPERINWIKPFESLSGETVYRHHFKKGILKAYAGLSYTDFEVIQDDINIAEGLNFKLNNRNLYFNTSYKTDLGKDWDIMTGLSFANDQSKLKITDTHVNTKKNSGHAKLVLKKRFSNYFKLNFGAEHFVNDFTEQAAALEFDSFTSNSKEHTSAAFAEANVFFSRKLAMQIGVRAENNVLLQEALVSPRTSLAYKMSSKSQVSLAYGDFYQTPSENVLKYDSDLAHEKASHFILNYLYQDKGKIFRAEAYHKKYNNLIKYDTETPVFNSEYNNTGKGFAQGLDLFWKDKNAIKHFEYWLSYSYLNTKRDYQNFPTEATPNFAAKHNFSLVTKYWIEDWKSLLSTSYNFASGRPYNNPNDTTFQNSQTKNFNSLDMSWAYLISQQKILYVSVSNVLGFNNVSGYQYSNTPDTNGNFNRRAIVPNADRFILVGFFWTISKNKNDNQLDNL